MNFIINGKEHLEPVPAKKELLRGLIGGFLGILLLLYLSRISANPFIMAPFGASCVILFAVSKSPLAQPRNVIFGHFVSAFVGLFFLKFIGHNIFAIAASVGMAVFFMQLFRCVHPPAGANPLVILLTADHIVYGWKFLIFPVLSGSIALILIAWIVNNFKRTDGQKWPSYGLALLKTR